MLSREIVSAISFLFVKLFLVLIAVIILCKISMIVFIILVIFENQKIVSLFFIIQACFAQSMLFYFSLIHLLLLLSHLNSADVFNDVEPTLLYLSIKFPLTTTPHSPPPLIANSSPSTLPLLIFNTAPITPAL